MLNYILTATLLLSLPVSVPQIHTPTIEHGRSTFSYVAQEKPTLNLFYTTYCPYSRKVLNYLNQIHKKVPMTNVENNPQAKEYLRTYGGKMQVPCLFINGQPLYESDEIIQWLSQHQDLLDPA
jgi:glutaredoxin 3